ncbi:MAG: hypothetical protein P8J68_06685 [Arenicellaceae bacterium]|nr:hypothetical protein [Arenicellaceae bacterium]
MKKVVKTIAAHCTVDGVWDQVISRLAIEGDIELSYCVIGVRPNFDKQYENFKSLFPGAVFHDSTAAIRGIPVLALSEPAIDESTLRALSAYESVLMRMLDRMDPMDCCFAYRDRYRHYIRLLRYWSAVLDEVNPDLVMFGVTPHMGWDYVLYLLARHRGINTVLFHFNSTLGRVMWCETIEGLSARVQVAQQLLQGTKVNKEVGTRVDKHLETTRREYARAIPKYMAMLETLNQSEKVNWSAKSWLGFVKSLAWALIFAARRLRKLLNRVFSLKQLYPDNYWKHSKMAFEDSHYSAAESAKVERYKLRKLKQLATCYTDLCINLSKDDFNAPFIFVALHYQPEASTCPDGGYFADQALMIGMLSKLLPEGWLLYVKEHSLQLQAKSSKAWQGRDPQFYRDLVNHSNVRLVSIDTPSFDLMDRSKAVSTITGYAGWEALVRGKPVILFGRPWYGACSGAFMVKTNKDLHIAISKIVDPTNNPVLADVKDYLIAYFLVSFSGFCNKWNKEASGVTDDENIDAFCVSIRDYLKNNLSI